jgi:hypothetical protein
VPVSETSNLLHSCAALGIGRQAPCHHALSAQGAYLRKHIAECISLQLTLRQTLGVVVCNVLFRSSGHSIVVLKQSDGPPQRFCR